MCDILLRLFRQMLLKVCEYVTAYSYLYVLLLVSIFLCMRMFARLNF